MERPEWPYLFLFFPIFSFIFFILTVLYCSYFLTPSIDIDIGHIHKGHSIYRNYKPPTSLHPPYDYDGVAHVPLVNSQEGPALRLSYIVCQICPKREYKTGRWLGESSLTAWKVLEAAKWNLIWLPWARDSCTSKHSNRSRRLSRQCWVAVSLVSLKHRQED